MPNSKCQIQSLDLEKIILDHISIVIIMTKKTGSGKSDLIDEIRTHVKKTFEEISEDFDVTRYKPWPETVDYLTLLPEGSNILDLGVGNGRNSVFAVKKGLNVLGIDFARAMVSLARSKFTGLSDDERKGTADFIQSDFGMLPVKDGSVDAVVCIASLHHLPSDGVRRRAASEIFRVLKSNGTAFISVWDLDQSRFKHELTRHLYSVCRDGRGSGSDEDSKEACHPPPYEFGDVWVPWQSKDSGGTYYRFYHLFYHDELTRLMESVGFEQVKYFRRADNHNIIVRKPF